MIDKIVIDGKTFALNEIHDQGKIRLVQNINGIQRLEKYFDKVEEFQKFMKKKNSIFFNERIDQFELKVEWVKE